MEQDVGATMALAITQQVVAIIIHKMDDSVRILAVRCNVTNLQLTLQVGQHGQRVAQNALRLTIQYLTHFPTTLPTSVHSLLGIMRCSCQFLLSGLKYISSDVSPMTSCLNVASLLLAS